MSSWLTIGIEFIKTLAGPGKGRSRPRTDNSTAGGGLTSGTDVRPESQTSIKTEDSPNQQELEGLASGAESIVLRPGNQPSTKTEDTPNQQELERRRKIVRQFFNDFWRSADAKPVTFAERLNLAEGYINERLVACGEAWQLDSAVRGAFLGCRFHADKPCLRVSYCIGYTRFLHSRKGRGGCMERIAIAMQDGGAGAGA